MDKYEELKERYPDPLSLDEVRRVCRIAKSSARYLVEHGIIPAIDTGKLTWRYKISIDDVIAYLKQREIVGSMIPRGLIKHYKGRRKSKVIRKTYSMLVEPGRECEIANYFRHIYADYDDVLTTNDVAEMTGLDLSTVINLCRQGIIKSLTERSVYLIPKQYLLEFVVTPRFIEAKTNSYTFSRIIGGFEIWKNVKL